MTAVFVCGVTFVSWAVRCMPINVLLTVVKSNSERNSCMNLKHFMKIFPSLPSLDPCSLSDWVGVSLSFAASVLNTTACDVIKIMLGPLVMRSVQGDMSAWGCLKISASSREHSGFAHVAVMIRPQWHYSNMLLITVSSFTMFLFLPPSEG